MDTIKIKDTIPSEGLHMYTILANQHADDCNIYSSLENHLPLDGICTCGYGLSLARDNDWSQMYSKERMEKELMKQVTKHTK